MFLAGWYAIISMFIWPVAVPYRLIRRRTRKQLNAHHVEMVRSVRRSVIVASATVVAVTVRRTRKVVGS